MSTTVFAPFTAPIPASGYRYCTLGPDGTCSQAAARARAAHDRVLGQVLLFGSFETAVEAVSDGQGDLAVVPSAYSGFNELVFRNVGNMGVVDTFVFPTPALMIAGRRGITVPACGTIGIASHAAPRPLLDRARASWPLLVFDVLDAASNAAAAEMVARGEVPLCLTTSDAARLHDLVALYEFGTVSMGWNVFARTREAGHHG